MVLTSPDLASSLHRWEIAEYISEGFVILACAGELIADLGASRLGEKRQKRLERWSTILLVAALTVSLKCLVRTNELSGMVIGSLGNMAEEAGTKARTAIADASTALSLGRDALAKAGAAQQSLSKAEEEAAQAQTAASSALTLARGARQEADSFERDIALAKKQAADIAKQLAPRTLNPSDWEAIGKQLKPFAAHFTGRQIALSSYSQDAEGIVFSLEIMECLTRAGISVDPAIGRSIPVGLVEMGVTITGPAEDGDFIKSLGTAISSRADDTLVHIEWNSAKYKDLAIRVGVKPIAGLPTVTQPK
jgi:hypothetical protein